MNSVTADSPLCSCRIKGPKHEPGCPRGPAIENKSGLKPLGRAVLVVPYEPELTKTSLVLTPQTRQNTQTLETRGIVVEAGPCAWDDEPAPRAKPGDKVLLSRLAGVMAKGTAPGETDNWYRLVNDRDIFCQIEVESNG